MKHFQLEQHQVRVTCDVSFSVGGALTGKWRVPEHPACLTHNRHLSTSKCFWSFDLQSDEESVIFLRVTHETFCAYFVFSVSFSDQSLAK